MNQLFRVGLVKLYLEGLGERLSVIWSHRGRQPKKRRMQLVKKKEIEEDIALARHLRGEQEELFIKKPEQILQGPLPEKKTRHETARESQQSVQEPSLKKEGKEQEKKKRSLPRGGSQGEGMSRK